MAFDDARILQLKLRFMAIARSICPGYQLTDDQKPTICDVFNWCLRLPGRLDPAKGLWIGGGIGTGKSTLLRIVNQFCYETRPHEPIGLDRFPLPFLIVIRSALEISDSYARDGIYGIDRIVKFNRLAIDDLGTENRYTNHYGTSTNVVCDLLLRRYDMRHSFQTFVTSNLLPEQISQVYGLRVYDRCGEMFNFVSLDGFSNRPPF